MQSIKVSEIEIEEVKKSMHSVAKSQNVVQLPWDQIKYKFHGYFILSILYVLFSIALYTVLQANFGLIF